MRVCQWDVRDKQRSTTAAGTLQIDFRFLFPPHPNSMRRDAWERRALGKSCAECGERREERGRQRTTCPGCKLRPSLWSEIPEPATRVLWSIHGRRSTVAKSTKQKTNSRTIENALGESPAATKASFTTSRPRLRTRREHRAAGGIACIFRSH